MTQSYPLKITIVNRSYSAFVLPLFVLFAQSYLFYQFQLKCPDPYMDEVFHIPQAIQYCNGFLKTWDPKITTFPGLYYLAGALSFMLRIPCNVVTLRGLNTLVVAGGIHLCTFYMLKQFHPTATSEWLYWRWLRINTLPITFFFYFLFYTDPLATLTILLLYLASYKSTPTYSAKNSSISRQTKVFFTQSTLAICALLARQTNVVWIFASACCKANRFLHKSVLLYSKHDTNGSNIKKYSFKSMVYDFIVTQHIPLKLIKIVLPEFLCCLGFLVFVKYFNYGHLTLGHQEYHQPSLHFAQIIYLTCTLGLFSASHVLKTTINIQSSFNHFSLTVLLLSLAIWMMKTGFVLHPFVLSDNRHLTFYVMRIVKNHTLIRLGVLPIIAAWCWTTLLSYFNSQLVNVSFEKTCKAIDVAIYSLCCCLVLIPTPLVEPRYFQIPVMLWLLHLPAASIKHAVSEESMSCLLHIILNVIILCLFFCCPFSYFNAEKNSTEIGRFIP